MDNNQKVPHTLLPHEQLYKLKEDIWKSYEYIRVEITNKENESRKYQEKSIVFRRGAKIRVVNFELERLRIIHDHLYSYFKQVNEEYQKQHDLVQN